MQVEVPSKLTMGLLLAAAGSMAFSGKAIIVKLAYRHGVDAVTLLMLRMVFALPFFLLMAWWAGRGKARLTPGDWLGVVGLGFCGYYLSSFLDFWGLEFITASLERLILYLNPTLVLVLGWLLFKKRITQRQGVAMAISYSGVLLVFGHELGLAGPHAAWGALLVFLSAVTYAVYLTYSGQLVQRLGALRLAGLATSVACFFCIVQFACLQPMTAVQVPEAVLWLSLLNATVCTVLPVLLVMMAIERIGPGLTAQTGMIGPMSTLMMGVWILGEPFNMWIIAGTVLVLGGVFWVTRPVGRKP
jgi:drug/metabolite transporter (DMT)-like permease